MSEEKIAELMKKWNCTEEEAREMLAWDEETDKMSVSQINAEMTPEQRKASKAARITTSGEKKERKVERKPNDDKRKIIGWLETLFLEEQSIGEVDKVNVSNIERQIDFVRNDVAYSITLTAHRKK